MRDFREPKVEGGRVSWSRKEARGEPRVSSFILP
jgi:hypothetical protein